MCVWGVFFLLMIDVWRARGGVMGGNMEYQIKRKKKRMKNRAYTVQDRFDDGLITQLQLNLDMFTRICQHFHIVLKQRKKRREREGEREMLEITRTLQDTVHDKTASKRLCVT